MIKTLYVFVFFLFVTGFARAQRIIPAWAGGADLHDLSFGFLFQYVNSDYKIVKDPNWRQPFLDPETNVPVSGTLKAVGAKGSPGFGVGFITRYTFTDHIELRTTPMLVFADRQIQYRFDDFKYDIDQIVSTTSVEIPLQLKLKSDRIGNFRGYVLSGLKYNAAINKRPVIDNLDPLSKPLLNARNFSSYEFGIGADIYFEYFKFSPELKLSNSFNDVLDHTPTPYAKPLSKLFLHTISFSIYFE